MMTFESIDDSLNFSQRVSLKMNRRTYFVRCVKFTLPLSLLFVIFWYILPFLSNNTDSTGMTISKSKVRHGHFEFNFKTSTFLLEDSNIYSDGTMTLTSLNESKQYKNIPVECFPVNSSRGCYLWHNQSKLDIQVKKMPDTNIICHKLSFTSLNNNFIPRHCFSLKSVHWFGGWQSYNQRWPLEETNIKITPFVASRHISHPFVSITERFWVNSKGVGIVIDDSVSLYVSFNDTGNNLLCFEANNRQLPYKNYPNIAFSKASLKYSLCKGDNVKSIHQFMIKRWFEITKASPNELMFKFPVWSTSMKLHRNEETVLGYGIDIAKNLFPCSLLKLHINLTGKFGDLSLNETNFLHAHQMIITLQGTPYYFNISLPITPFASHDSRKYEEGKQNKYWLINKHEVHMMIIEREKKIQTKVAVLDVTNPKAIDWFVSRLKQIQGLDHYHINAFEFYFGEPPIVPEKYESHAPVVTPSEFTEKYTSIATHFGNRSLVHSVYKSQANGIFVEMLPKVASWEYDNGLKTVIPNVLQIGIMGYPFIVGSIIGGSGETLDKELFIRWLELSAYLPVMQFSTPPWKFDDEVVNISRKFVKIHETEVSPLLFASMKETFTSGAPLIRPVWWVDPNDPTALHLDCEFMVGDDLLVAPVLNKGARKRDVYLPNGSWKDHLNNKDIEGGRWHRNYPVALDEIATFQLKKNPF